MSGYGDFFKQAKRQAKAKGSGPQISPSADYPTPKKSKTRRDLSEYSEQELRHLFRLDKNPKRDQRLKPGLSGSSLASVIHFFGLAGLLVLSTVLIVFQSEEWNPLSEVQLDIFGQAKAQDQEKSTTQKPPQPAKSAADSETASSGELDKNGAKDQQKPSYFANLNQRKEELDLREKELAELERELQSQREQVESRIEYLESIRREIAGVLKERVEMDEAKVTQLVDFYSNMKPEQAANIISKLNDDLAIQVLSKMKKKNAAQILNMIEPGKARVLSEKFAGYQPKN